ncbi:MAG: alpha/beta hydrolase [Verrucomicrobiota bacterium]
MKSSLTRTGYKCAGVLLALNLALNALAAVAAGETNAAPGSITLPLWPGTPPGKVSAKEEMELPARGDGVRRITNVQQPTITVFPAKASQQPAPAVVICPGGAYNILAMDKEGTDVADWLNGFGFTAVLLKYRVPGNREGAFMDVQRAMRLVRQHAKEWAIDPQRLGIMGFSAGGHLSARLSTGFATPAYAKIDSADEQSCRPDFTVLIYPAYLADKKGELAKELVVTPQMAPTFVLHTRDDDAFIAGSQVYTRALKAAKVPLEFQLFDTGGHGYGLHPIGPASHWPELCAEWLKKTTSGSAAR